MLFVTSLLSAAVAAPVQSSLGPKVLATFDGSSGTTYNWVAENDPVMGGVSSSTATSDKAGKDLVWAGQVKIVPFLHAPGFCTVRTESASIPDISDYVSGGIALQLKMSPSKTNLTTFQFQFQSAVRSDPKKGGFQGDFDVQITNVNDEVQSIFIPFSSFKETWRGEPEGGAPTKLQLTKIEQIGIGAAGVAGTFELDLISVSVALSAPGPSPGPGPAPAPPADAIELVSFAAGSPHLYTWTDLNDPVMGGLSTSSFKVHPDEAIGVFNGTVRIVPSLKAPGFCNAEARAGLMAKMPDASSAIAGGLVYTVMSTGTLSSFKASFGTGFQYNFGSYKADFTVPNDGQYHAIYIPFTAFSNQWSAATGEPTTKCSPKHKEVCPNTKALKTLGSVGVWAEGAAGDFHLVVKSIAAVAQAPPSSNDCAGTEFCCPDAKACLTPTGVSCAKNANACSTGQICCPFTKECVTASHPCIPVPECKSTEFCCPDAKHCLTPVAPGTMCDPSDKSACPAPQVCCPLIKQCVAVGVACDPSPVSSI